MRVLGVEVSDWIAGIGVIICLFSNFLGYLGFALYDAALTYHGYRSGDLDAKHAHQEVGVNGKFDPLTNLDTFIVGFTVSALLSAGAYGLLTGTIAVCLTLIFDAFFRLVSMDIRQKLSILVAGIGASTLMIDLRNLVPVVGGKMHVMQNVSDLSATAIVGIAIQAIGGIAILIFLLRDERVPFDSIFSPQALLFVSALLFAFNYPILLIVDALPNVKGEAIIYGGVFPAIVSALCVVLSVCITLWNACKAPGRRRLESTDSSESESLLAG